MNWKQLNQCLGFPRYLKNLVTISFFERTVCWKWCSHQTVIQTLSSCHFQSCSQAALLLFEDVTVNCTSSVRQIALCWWDGNYWMALKSLKFQRLISVNTVYTLLKGLSLLVLCKILTEDRPTSLCIMLGPSDKLAIKLKLMSNLLEGMHISDLRLQKCGHFWNTNRIPFVWQSHCFCHFPFFQSISIY